MSSRAFGRIHVVAVGKLRTPHWKAAQEDYLHRLSRYTTFQLLEVKDGSGRNIPDKEARQVEGQRLLKAVPGGTRLIVMTERGREYTSPKLARFLQQRIEQFGHLTFLVGGPAGLSREIEGVDGDRLALSRLTLPHELARVVLLEQIYRAFTILRGEPYHK